MTFMILVLFRLGIAISIFLQHGFFCNVRGRRSSSWKKLSSIYVQQGLHPVNVFGVIKAAQCCTPSMVSEQQSKKMATFIRWEINRVKDNPPNEVKVGRNVEPGEETANKDETKGWGRSSVLKRVSLRRLGCMQGSVVNILIFVRSEQCLVLGPQTHTLSIDVHHSRKP